MSDVCATAIVWSGIKTLVYGYSITEAIAEGRKRINLTCKELFERANVNIKVQVGVMHDQCSLLYRNDVRDEIKKLRGTKKEDLESLQDHLFCKRIEWYKKNQAQLGINNQDLVLSGYELILKKLEIKHEEAPIVMRTKNKVVFHSKNFCPTLEACKILDLDTRMICKDVNEKPTDTLVKQLSDRLEFARNYEKLRPYCDYCEEMVLLKEVDLFPENSNSVDQPTLYGSADVEDKTERMVWHGVYQRVAGSVPVCIKSGWFRHSDPNRSA